MKELGHVVASNEVRFGTLKLMVLYRNSERILADALGSDDGITIFYYHNTVSYKYRGKFRVQNILSSIHYVMSLSPDELPLKSLTTTEELGDFLHSTDKAVLLVDFCGWIPRVVGMDKSKTESDLGMLFLYPVTLSLFLSFFLSFFQHSFTIPNSVKGLLLFTIYTVLKLFTLYTSSLI